MFSPQPSFFFSRGSDVLLFWAEPRDEGLEVSKKKQSALSLMAGINPYGRLQNNRLAMVAFASLVNFLRLSY